MGTIISPASTFNSIISSTGYCPSDWRPWWREQSVIDGTDWRTLIECAEAALSGLRLVHGVSSS